MLGETATAIKGNTWEEDVTGHLLFFLLSEKLPLTSFPIPIIYLYLDNSSRWLGGGGGICIQIRHFGRGISNFWLLGTRRT